MEVTTFKKILKFIYTGSEEITTEDVLPLIKACDFLKLHRVENLCVDFIEKNVQLISVKNAVDIYNFARATKRKLLASVLYIHVREMFEPFSETTDFLEMPSDAVVKMLKQISAGAFAKEGTIVQAIIRWVNHDREARCHYAHKLSDLAQVTHLSIPLSRSLLANSFLNESHTLEHDQEQESVEVTDEMCLYVYIRAALKPNTKKILYVDKNCSDFAAIPMSKNTNMVFSPWVYSVALNGLMYSLHQHEYTGSSSKKMGWKLSSSTSINMLSDAKSLTSPPSNLNDFRFTFDFCGMERNQILYLYDKQRSVDPNRNIYNIFSYSCENDSWSTIKNMKIPLNRASMTAGFETLYLIGGRKLNGLAPVRYAQAYDYCGVWRELPLPHYSHKNAVSCVFDSKLYVCSPDGLQCEGYDIRAGKWNVMEPAFVVANKMVQKIIPFSNKLWLFSGDISRMRCYRNNFQVHLYDLVSNRWSDHLMLNKAVEGTPWQNGCVNDAVVFEPLQIT